MEWVEANGASFRCELSGGGDETLVLIHELGGSLDSWDLTLPALRDNFRVLRYDQRGFGQSEKFSGALSLDIMNGDLIGLLDHYRIEGPVHVIGIALGAGIGIGFAAAHPDRVKSLIATSPATGAATAEARERSLQRAQLVEEGGMRAAVDTSMANSFPEEIRRAVVRFPAYRRRWLTNDPQGFAAINRMLANMDLNDDYAKVKCPTLVVGGRMDGLRPPSIVKPIADAIPNSTYVELDTGHFMHVQSPELFLEHALPFLTGN